MGQWSVQQQQGLLLAPELLEFRQVLTEEVTQLNMQGFTQEKLAISSTNSQMMPRYVRVNSLRMPLKNVLTLLGQEGWKVRRLRPQITQTKFKKLVSRLQAPKLYVDPHIGGLLIFPNGTDLHNHELVKQGALILQDKASCIPAQLLSPEPGSCVLDACAAPGMKTTHLAALMQNRGTIFAFDRCRDRLALLKEFVSKADVHICRAENRDFLRVDVHNFPAEVNYVLLDPPCSGSGMAKRNEFDEAAHERVDQKRIQSLANLQSMMLKHALRLPSLQRLVYSTCSVHWAENEAVVLEALADPEIGANFELAEPDDAIPNWTHRGQGRRERTTNSSTTNDAVDESPEEEEEKDGGEESLLLRCLRASPEQDLTNGFFVALFQRKYP